MNVDSDKLMSMSKAVSRFVPEGVRISIGGFTVKCNPMAAVYEISGGLRNHFLQSRKS